MYYINTFLFYSILGHFLENFIYRKIDSGILYGYWTPIYGMGALFIMFIFYLISNLLIDYKFVELISKILHINGSIFYILLMSIMIQVVIFSE